MPSETNNPPEESPEERIIKGAPSDEGIKPDPLSLEEEKRFALAAQRQEQIRASVHWGMILFVRVDNLAEESWSVESNSAWSKIERQQIESDPSVVRDDHLLNWDNSSERLAGAFTSTSNFSLANADVVRPNKTIARSIEP